MSFVSGGGDLALEDPTAFAGVIAGLALSSQKIDLGGFVYGSAETVSWTQFQGGLSGTLTVTDGAALAHLTLTGAYATSNFVLSDDGHGGTFVADPRVADGRAVVGLAQAMALFATGTDLAIDGVASASTASAALSDHVGLALGR